MLQWWLWVPEGTLVGTGGHFVENLFLSIILAIYVDDIFHNFWQVLEISGNVSWLGKIPTKSYVKMQNYCNFNMFYTILLYCYYIFASHPCPELSSFERSERPIAHKNIFHLYNINVRKKIINCENKCFVWRGEFGNAHWRLYRLPCSHRGAELREGGGIVRAWIVYVKVFSDIPMLQWWRWMPEGTFIASGGHFVKKNCVSVNNTCHVCWQKFI